MVIEKASGEGERGGKRKKRKGRKKTFFPFFFPFSFSPPLHFFPITLSKKKKRKRTNRKL
jgi:hypothetical protein